MAPFCQSLFQVFENLTGRDADRYRNAHQFHDIHTACSTFYSSYEGLRPFKSAREFYLGNLSRFSRLSDNASK